MVKFDDKLKVKEEDIFPKELPLDDGTASSSRTSINVEESTSSKKKGKDSFEKGGVSASTVGDGAGKPGWRRVSTRQWIRDFREHIGKFQTYPYRPICGIFFWTFGYYPDMAPPESFQKYVAKHPIAARHHSLGAAANDQIPMVISVTEFTAEEDEPGHVIYTVPPSFSTADLHLNENKEKFERHQQKRKTHGHGTKGARGTRHSIAVSALTHNTTTTGTGSTPTKGSESHHIKHGGGVHHSTTGTTHAHHKEHKVHKGHAAVAAEVTEEDHIEGTGVAGEGHAGKKIKKKGRKTHDDTHDMSTLVVMNIPDGTNKDKLHNLFPGSTTVELEDNGMAHVMFKTAAAARPFLSKKITIDGIDLVISAKLKT